MSRCAAVQYGTYQEVILARAIKEILWPFEARIFEFWQGFGDGAGPQRPATEPKRRQNSKRPLSLDGFKWLQNFFNGSRVDESDSGDRSRGGFSDHFV